MSPMQCMDRQERHWKFDLLTHSMLQEPRSYLYSWRNAWVAIFSHVFVLPYKNGTNDITTALSA